MRPPDPLPLFRTRRQAAAAVALAGLLLAAFAATLLEVVGACWKHAEYGHGLLMPLVAAWLVWNRRRELRAQLAASEPGWQALAAAVALAPLGLLLLLGEMKLSWFLKPFAFIGALVCCIVVLWGMRGLRALLRPLVVLALACPIPWRILNWATIPLKRHATVLATGLIDATGLKGSLEGNLIHVPGISSLWIADACSGVRSLISLLAVAIVACLFWRRHWSLKALLVASCVPIAVLVNGVRIWSTALLAAKVSPKAADEFWHTCEGFLLFFVAAVVLAGVGYLIHRLSGPGRPASVPAERPRATPWPRAARLAFATALLLLAVSAVGAHRMRSRLGGEGANPAAKAALQAALDRLPVHLPGSSLQGEVVELDAATVAASGADAYRSIAYRDDRGDAFHVYIGGAYRNDDNFHAPDICMPTANWEVLRDDTVSRGAAGPVRRLLLMKGREQILVFYWFQAGERVACDEWTVRWYRLVDLLRGAPLPPTMIVTCYVPVREGIEEAHAAGISFLDMLDPYLRDAAVSGGIHG